MAYQRLSSQKFEEQYHYDGQLGALYTPEETTFCIWAPTARQVELLTYQSGHQGQACAVYPMEQGPSGTWRIALPGDQHGVYYTYRVSVRGHASETVDPYAKACGVNGMRGMVVDLSRTNPEGWSSMKRPALHHAVDAIVYELHIRDATIHPDSGVVHRGKYLGLTEQDTKGPEGVWTGLRHLKELGVTHVQLMPCFDFATVDEEEPDACYNWGYDPQNYNVPEGSYATDPYHGEVRIYELKCMIQALKQQGLRVIMDVVYNHTYYGEDSHLNNIVPGYYYRQDSHGHFTNGSGCGNEVASERSMVRKMIKDSVVYWAKEYQMDGFRFDLMGLHDLFLINEIRSALNDVDPTILMYGEGWTGGLSPLPDGQKALKGHVRQLPGTGVFNDDVRDGLKGHVFFADRPGFVNGAVGMEESVKCGMVGASEHSQVDYEQVLYSHWAWAGEPAQSINYVEAHDNLTLWDKLSVDDKLDEEERIKMHKMCGCLILTSQGIPFLHAGMEFLRTKENDHNSYRSSDKVNRIDWGRKAKYQSVFQYYQGLIALRKAHPAFRITTSAAVNRHVQFLEVPDSQMISCMIHEANNDPWKTILVIANANSSAKTLPLPGQGWVVVVNHEQAGTSPLDRVRGSRVVVPGRTCMILVDEESYTGGGIE